MFCILFILILDKKSKNEKKIVKNILAICLVILEKNCNLEWKKNWRVAKKKITFVFIYNFNVIIIVLFTFPTFLSFLHTHMNVK